MMKRMELGMFLSLVTLILALTGFAVALIESRAETNELRATVKWLGERVKADQLNACWGETL